jgi:hypothetical protein
MERRIEILAAAKQSVHELLRPSPIARIEGGSASIKGGIEQHSVPEVGEHVSSRNACVRHTRMMNRGRAE